MVTAMKMRYEWVFIGAVGVVAVCLALVWRADERAAGAGLSAWGPATVAAGPAGNAAPGAGPATAAMTAPVTAATTTAAPTTAAPTTAAPTMLVPPLGSDAERAQTRDQRLAALPVLLAAADQGIAALQAELEQAQARGSDAGAIAAMTARLDEMQRVRSLVLARNSDIVD